MTAPSCPDRGPTARPIGARQRKRSPISHQPQPPERRFCLGCGLASVSSKARRYRDRGRTAQSGPDRAPTVQSGQPARLGPVNLADRSRPCRLSVKLRWNLSSGLPHSFCRTWWKPRGALLEFYSVALQLRGTLGTQSPPSSTQQCQAFTLLHSEFATKLLRCLSR